MPTNEKNVKDLLDAKTKVRVAVVGAFCSLAGALISAWISYNATTSINAERQKATIEIAKIKDQIERGTLAMNRAKLVERLLGDLISGEETAAKMAFLNLWQLHPDPTERSIFVLTALEKSGESVVKTLVLLKSELHIQMDKIREAADPSNCTVGGVQECAITQNAKSLLMQIEPDDTLELLLKQIASYPSNRIVSLDDTNVELIGIIANRGLQYLNKLEEKYINEYNNLKILSYILYSLGREQYFRNIISNNVDIEVKYKLIRGIVTAPLQELKKVDWNYLINIASDTLESNENPTVMLDMIRLLDRARVSGMLNQSDRNSLEITFSNLATSTQTESNVRRRSIGILANISPEVAVRTVKNIAAKEGELSRILQMQIVQSLDKPKVRDWLTTSFDLENVPNLDEDFENWRRFLEEIDI